MASKTHAIIKNPVALQQLIGSGKTPLECMQILDISKATLYRSIQRYGLDGFTVTQVKRDLQKRETVN